MNLQWPTRSPDAGVNFVVIVVVTVLGLLAIIVFGTIAAVALAAFLIWKVVQWYMNRPVPTDVLATQTQQRAITANFPETKQFMLNLIERVLESADGRYPTNSVYMFLIEAIRVLYDGEGLDNLVEPIPPRDTIEEGRYRDRLLAHMTKTADAPRTLRAVSDTLGRLGRDIIAHLPPMAVESREQFTADDRPAPFATVPLVDALADVRPLVKAILLVFHSDEVNELNLFSAMRKQLSENFDNCGQVFPEKFKGTPREVVSAYLQNTFFEKLFDLPIPFSVSIGKQLEHTMIVGGTRWGKSQLIGSIVNQHLKSEKPPSIILIDSTGDFQQKIQRLALFDPDTGPLKDRLVIIDPEDKDPPALNMFDVSALRKKNYTPQQLEQVEADIIDLFDYVFETLGAGMTARQSTGFSFLCRLLISIPGSNITSLRQLLQSDADSYAKVPVEVRGAIEGLDQTTQDFFKHQFFTKATQATRRQIASRLFDIVRVPAFERMFSGVNKVDFFEAMQAGKIILVNTSKAALKPDASALFGRYIIARVLSGAFERVVIPMEQRRPCLMFVDEAQEYFDAIDGHAPDAGGQVQTRHLHCLPIRRSARPEAQGVGARKHNDQVRGRRDVRRCTTPCARDANDRGDDPSPEEGCLRATEVGAVRDIRSELHRARS